MNIRGIEVCERIEQLLLQGRYNVFRSICRLFKIVEYRVFPFWYKWKRFQPQQQNPFICSWKQISEFNIVGQPLDILGIGSMDDMHFFPVKRNSEQSAVVYLEKFEHPLHKGTLNFSVNVAKHYIHEPGRKF
jgi:hypothetical protein